MGPLGNSVQERLPAAQFSAAAMRNGRLLAHRHTPAQPLLPVYSFTKTYIAVLTLLTVRARRLALDATLDHWCPDVPQARRITLSRLLNHSAGVPDYGGLEDYQRDVASGEPPWSWDRFADHTYRRGLLFDPGEGWSYANPGYALVVHVLEQVWQRPLGELLTDLITAPLALEHTRLADTLDHPDICPSVSPALSPDGTPRPVNTHYSPGWVWHRLIVSDAMDSVRFLDAVLRQRWLGDRLTAAMTTLLPVGETHVPWTTPSYGLGLMGEPDGARGAIYGHNGGGPGYTASAYYVERTHVSVAVIAATEDPDAVLSAALNLHDRMTTT